MAKALLGYVGGPDPRLETEMHQLRRRVTDLEAEVRRLQEENDTLLRAGVPDAELVLDDTPVPEPALT